MGPGAARRKRLVACLEASARWIEAELERTLDAAERRGSPPRLVQAVRHALMGGGKRLRPALVRLVCSALGGDDAAAAAPAVAVEMVHAYSLVHDDLPCMDDDEWRRGRPTCHVAFGQALAVLAGDALLTEAFGVLSGAGGRAAEMAAVLAAAAGPAGMVGGQVLDLSLAGGAADRAQVEAVHRAKTAALLGAAAELGALAAGAGDERRAAAREYGLALGLSFQAVDDVLDVTGDAGTLGKTPGKDERHDRATLVALLGLEGARAEAARLAGLARERAAQLGFGPEDPGFELVGHLLERSR